MEKIREYAAAVGLDPPLHREDEASRRRGFRATVAPPLFGAVYVAPAVASVMFDPSVGVFDPEVGLAGYRLVQRRQRFEWGAPVCSGDTITTVASLAESGERDGAAFRIFESESVNDAGEIVLRGSYEGVVPRAGGSANRTAAREQSVRRGHGAAEELPAWRMTPDRYAPIRYAGASGDFTPFHLDSDVARANGLPGVILHGLYTLAQLARALTERFDHDPRSLHRLDARFRRPAVPEQELEVVASIRERLGAEEHVECSVLQGGRTVVEDGLAVLRQPDGA